MMTKEELEKEAKDSWWNDNNCSGALSTEKIYECGYLAGAGPREKQIQIDTEQIRALQKDKGELTDRVKELEAQIEDMKRYLDCEYCEHYTQPWGCKNCNEEIRSDWKLKEIKENG